LPSAESCIRRYKGKISLCRPKNATLIAAFYYWQFDLPWYLGTEEWLRWLGTELERAERPERHDRPERPERPEPERPDACDV